MLEGVGGKRTKHQGLCIFLSDALPGCHEETGPLMLPHLQALLQLPLDKDANKQKCLLRQKKANEKPDAAAAVGKET